MPGTRTSSQKEEKTVLEKGSLISRGGQRPITFKKPTVGTEWNTMPSVNEKADLLQEEENRSIEGGTGG